MVRASRGTVPHHAPCDSTPPRWRDATAGKHITKVAEGIGGGYSATLSPAHVARALPLQRAPAT
eukprot:2754293-Prymnesium_polylepis.1